MDVGQDRLQVALWELSYCFFQAFRMFTRVLEEVSPTALLQMPGSKASYKANGGTSYGSWKAVWMPKTGNSGRFHFRGGLRCTALFVVMKVLQRILFFNDF